MIFQKNSEEAKKRSSSDNKKPSAAAIIAAAVAASWILLELILFIISIPNAPEVNAEDYCRTKTENGVYLIEKDTKLVFSPECGEIDSISFYAMSTDPNKYTESAVTVNVRGYDPATTAQMTTYRTEKICVGSADEVRTTIRVDVARSAGRIEIEFSHEGFDYSVRALTFNSPKDAKFNFIRTAIVLIVVAVLWTCSHFGLWKKYFDPRNRSHTGAAWTFCLACVVLAMVFVSLFNSSMAPTKYPFVYAPEYYNPYEQQFDAFMKGQLHLDIEPSEELKELENPYDPGNRAGVEYSWDRAYYNGKYYSYFGIAPLLTVYFPYYFLTGDLPADDTVTAIFTVLTALFFSLAAIKWASMYTKRLPIPLLFIGVLSALFSSQVFLIMRGRSKFYYIATIAGMAFLALFIWLLLCAASGTMRFSPLEEKERKRWKKVLFYALAGLAYGLLFLSRFNMALFAAFAVVPFVWFKIITRRSPEADGGKRRIRGIKEIALELSALGLPVVAAILFQLIFNAARFDEIFEFGTKYQLTVSDISMNRVRLSDLPFAIFHYFLQPLSMNADMPLFSLGYVTLGDYGHYSYIDTGMGLLSNPMMWMLFGSVILFLNKDRRTSHKIALGSVIFGGVVVALFNFCLGGVIFRYTCDLTLLYAFAAMAVMFFVHEDMEKGKDVLARRSLVTCSALAVAAIFVCLSLAMSLNGNLTAYPIEAYIGFKEIFTLF